jgi:predicted nucleic acid-binding protein
VVSLVVDASVTVAWSIERERTPYAKSVLDAVTDGDAFVPAHWPLEVANALLVNERRRVLTSAQVDECFEYLEGLGFRIEEVELALARLEILPLCRIHRLTAYDAAYLQLAYTMEVPLATLDGALIRAARNIGVSIFQPGT